METAISWAQIGTALAAIWAALVALYSVWDSRKARTEDRSIQHKAREEERILLHAERIRRTCLDLVEAVDDYKSEATRFWNLEVRSAMDTAERAEAIVALHKPIERIRIQPHVLEAQLGSNFGISQTADESSAQYLQKVAWQVAHSAMIFYDPVVNQDQIQRENLEYSKTQLHKTINLMDPQEEVIQKLHKDIGEPRKNNANYAVVWLERSVEELISALGAYERSLLPTRR